MWGVDALEIWRDVLVMKSLGRGWERQQKGHDHDQGGVMEDEGKKASDRPLGDVGQ